MENEAERELTVGEVLAEGMRRHRIGHLAEAERAYRVVLAAVPDQVDALHYLGVLLHQTGFEQQGIESIERAVALCPDYADAHSNLGNLLRSQGRLTDAANAYRRALASNPEHVDALNNLGVVLKDLGQLDEAAAILRKAIGLVPNRGDTHLNLGNVLVLKHCDEEARAEYQRAIQIKPGLLGAYDALSRALRQVGREKEATEVLERLVEQVPDSPIAKHLLAAATGRDVPAQASESYVQHIFDSFAEVFDRALENLEYRAPALVAAVVAAQWPDSERRLDVLDAGCGTGLCGLLLRPVARSLTGVDLSTRMLSKARTRGIYDALFQSDLTRFIRAYPAAFDLIVSADTLVYFGDLAPPLTAAALALRPGGWLVFTVEDSEADQTEEGYRLHPHGRYSHNEVYVRATLASAGFGPPTIQKDVLRKEGGKPVAGLVVGVAKPVPPG